MSATKSVILNHQEINNKIRRIAYQIYESNANETEVILAGIENNGFIMAKKQNFPNKSYTLQSCD